MKSNVSPSISHGKGCSPLWHKILEYLTRQTLALLAFATVLLEALLLGILDHAFAFSGIG